jgi:hypothetical protein
MGRRESKSYASFGLWNESDAVPPRAKTLNHGGHRVTEEPSFTGLTSGLFRIRHLFSR